MLFVMFTVRVVLDLVVFGVFSFRRFGAVVCLVQNFVLGVVTVGVGFGTFVFVLCRLVL